MLRAKIQAIIEKSANPEMAAFQILAFLDEEIGLDGNGWFDGDQKMEDFLATS